MTILFFWHFYKNITIIFHFPVNFADFSPYLLIFFCFSIFSFIFLDVILQNGFNVITNYVSFSVLCFPVLCFLFIHIVDNLLWKLWITLWITINSHFAFISCSQFVLFTIILFSKNYFYTHYVYFVLKSRIIMMRLFLFSYNKIYYCYDF